MKNVYKIYNLVFFCFLVSSCQQKPVEQKSPFLFPEGEYTQNVQLEIQKPKDISIPFISLTRLQKGKFKILGLTPFGTKAFEAEGQVENPESTVVKFHMSLPPSIKPEFVQKTLAKIQKLHNIKDHQLSSKDNYKEFRDQNFQLKIFQFNSDGIPSTFELIDDGWKAYIQTSKYRAL